MAPARDETHGPGAMSLCILAGAGMIKIAADVFMLGWTHSVEKTRWEEDWRVGENGLQLTQARIEGMGAGMETPPDAVFDGVWWAAPEDAGIAGGAATALGRGSGRLAPLRRRDMHACRGRCRDEGHRGAAPVQVARL